MLKKIPYFRQSTPWNCGPAAMRMALASLDIQLSESQLSRLLKTTKQKGTPHKSLPSIAEHLQLNFIVERNTSLKKIRQLQKQKYIVLLAYTPQNENFGHFAILKSITKSTITLIDPEYSPNYSLPIKNFLAQWKDSENNKRWFFAIRKS